MNLKSPKLTVPVILLASLSIARTENWVPAPSLPNSVMTFVGLGPEPPTKDEIVERHLATADAACSQIPSQHLRAIDEFFAGVKSRTPEFASAMLGLKSKWKIITGGHEEYIHATFEQQLFSTRRLEELLALTIAAVLADMQAVENQMLVNLGADMADLPNARQPLALDAASFQAQFQKFVAASSDAATDDLVHAVMLEVVSQVATRVASQAAARTGVSAGILGIGAKGAVFTKGISLAGALLVDFVVAQAWDWWADPRGELSQQLNAEFDNLAKELKATAETELNRIVAERSALRREAVTTLLSPVQ